MNIHIVEASIDNDCNIRIKLNNNTIQQEGLSIKGKPFAMQPVPWGEGAGASLYGEVQVQLNKFEHLGGYVIRGRGWWEGGRGSPSEQFHVWSLGHPTDCGQTE